jgi:hypothetical protein
MTPQIVLNKSKSKVHTILHSVLLHHNSYKQLLKGYDKN